MNRRGSGWLDNHSESLPMSINWQALFVPQTSTLELLIRGSVMYLALFLLLRVVIRRHVGALNIMDLLVIVIIADAAQNGMAGEYRTITEGIILCATIVGWSWALDWLAFRIPKLRPWLEPPPMAVIRNGRMIRVNMKRELISEEELMSKLREQGIFEIGEVRAAFIESDGQFSVLRQSRSPDQQQRPKNPAAGR